MECTSDEWDPITAPLFGCSPCRYVLRLRGGGYDVWLERSQNAPHASGETDDHQPRCGLRDNGTDFRALL